jgi:hypothetical protein
VGSGKENTMARAALFVALSLAGAARAALPEVSARVHIPLQLSAESLGISTEPACASPLAPEPWVDASDALFFATHPVAWDDQELSTATLAPLMAIRFSQGSLRLLVLGTPIRTGLHFSTTGWRPRWPFC